jgi:hypothetical protein
MVLLPVVFLALAAPGGASVTTPAACASAEAREFDFWIGDWKIDQRILRADGSWLSLPARTSVSSVLEGCALLERWQGEVQFDWEQMQRPEAMRGLSLRSYDPKQGQWQIHWMDTRHPLFGAPFVGGFRDGRGEFLRAPASAGDPQTRIVFSDVRAGSVHWELAISRDGQKWTTVWTMDMRRSAPEAVGRR